ncbi:polysaccharide deacetylase [Paenibacillus aceris]|uniref:Peptidoglycan/xylan/chitin deacetylase (PgdA/CDA1 family) n=1 Tax=Paenibacillus aceris TaxID=869555 RepID=A0ABS4I1C5_9BACL|nr:polysaccharide deacetylase [Paenibacillus aceris]MBP1964605.1 peptidoglycan/xylan/chitin deacetylase (PgdA/CDA1 family) [Paenibacillus aceris]NHW33596.1 polysaccharide deacetylase family protein [Paenibacillus aceris]
MRFLVHHAASNRKRIQLTMVFLLLVSLFLSAVPVRAAEEDGNSAKEGQDIYQKLKNGKRIQEEKSYVTPEQPTVYLTFDDGPSKLTGKVLDILKEEGVKATFFALGEQAKEYPDMVKRIVNEGHTLGNHSYNHVYNELYSDFQTFWDQIQSSEDVFADIADIRPQLVRAPGGTFTNFDAYYYYLMDQAGYTVVDWNVDSGDSKRLHVPSSEIWQTVKGSPLEHELTVLFHDGTGHESTVEVLPKVIDYYKNLGYAFAPLTTEVKPEQFRVGKSKWSRSMSAAHFQQLWKETQQYASAHPHPGQQTKEEPKNTDEQIAKMKVAAAEEEAKLLAAQPAVPLQVRFSQWSSVTLEPTEYQLRANRLELPLRFLIEKIGGNVHWQEKTKTANAHYGIYDVEYDLPARTIRAYALGSRVATYSLADMEIQGGSMIVPLRKTVDSLGGRITDTVMEPGRREVSMAFRHFYMLKENNSNLKNSLFAMAG